MGRCGQRYTTEFKDRAVKLVESSDKPTSVVARELGIDPSTLRKWRQEASQVPSSSSANPFELAEELKRLRKENARLIQENEILLKASAFFASRHA